TACCSSWTLSLHDALPIYAAKQLGGRLVVAINSDESVRALKGDGRPLMPAEERAEIVAALADVDAVVIFPELDVRNIIREIRPRSEEHTSELQSLAYLVCR